MAIAPPGWFGKIASLGDFASRRLTPEWVQACDGWLSASMASSRAQLGEQWLSTYLGAPVWRFAWAPQVVDSQWWFGVLMPSCDRVGRYFPLIVAQPRLQPPTDRFGLDHLELWWAQLAQSALQTLDEGVQIDSFEAALADLPAWPAPRKAAAAALQPGSVPQLSWPQGAGLDELMHGLATDTLQQRLLGHSLWCPWRPTAASVPCCVVQGLPQADSFAQVLLTTR